MPYRLSRAAISDVADALLWSEDNFGSAAARRYRALVAAALDDVAEDPVRVGSVERPEIGVGVRTWHLRLSRQGAAEGAVKRPRHLLLYRIESDDMVAIGRLLHDRMDIERNVEIERDFE